MRGSLVVSWYFLGFCMICFMCRSTGCSLFTVSLFIFNWKSHIILYQHSFWQQYHSRSLTLRGSQSEILILSQCRRVRWEKDFTEFSSERNFKCIDALFVFHYPVCTSWGLSIAISSPYYFSKYFLFISVLTDLIGCIFLHSNEASKVYIALALTQLYFFLAKAGFWNCGFFAGSAQPKSACG